MIRLTSRLVLTGICTASLSGAVLAHDLALDGPIEIPEDSAAYVTSDGEAIRTGDGHCLKLGGFSEDTQVDACEGIEEQVVEAAPEPEPGPEVAAPPEPTATIALREVDERAFFEFDSANLTEEGEAELAGLLTELERYEDITAINVVGYTDSIGTEEYNLDLSERRAATVAALLTTAYPDARVSIDGRGEQNPIATNDTSEGRQMNRRVEIEVTAEEMTFE